jgi:predicted site-specific integrase-resolvase
MPQHEVAKLCGVERPLLSVWRQRGHLKLAPVAVDNRSLRGRDDLIWSAAAVEEAVNYAKERASQRERRSDRQNGQGTERRGAA